MSVKVHWEKDGPRNGVLTRKAVPDPHGQELPIIIEDVGPTMLPGNLKGIKIWCKRSSAAMDPKLIQDAKDIGFDLRAE